MKEPPFCPNPHCPFHTAATLPTRWYIKQGFYTNMSGPPVQRYRCTRCRHRFSSRTFSIDYYGKCSLDYHHLMTFLVSGMCLRAMARAFHHSPRTIANKISRLARQILAFNSLLINRINLQENLVADGLESFVTSQYFPNNFTILVGKDSQMVYDLTYAQLRRKGAMTEAQKARAARYRRKYPLPSGQIRISFTHLAREAATLLRRSSRMDTLILSTDEKKEYRQPLADYPTAGLPDTTRKRIIHHQTNSSEPRTHENPLYAVNYIDREVRKDLAEHHRESVCFARNVNASLERMTVYLYHHNCIKAYRINKKDCVSPTHAQVAGVDKLFLRSQTAHLCTLRSLFTRQQLNLHAERLWRRAYPTPKKLLWDPLPAYVLA